MAKRKSEPPSITVSHSVRAYDLIEYIAESLTFDQIHEFIVELDKSCQDWGVTERLFNHFAEEMKKLPEDEAS
ncbi:hypothetical protein [Burkholderia gladioli]|uniref:hypothetical protein n=1 Tax=Burkholderia gladioli TaxID=28095 RepID=UPI001641C560|nr:hypothetical protein [Burkholderia gladioli]